MKIIRFASLLVALLAITACGNHNDNPVSLDDEGVPQLTSMNDTLSWVYGQNLADILTNQEVFKTLNADVVMQSARHALANAKQPFTPEETREALEYLYSMHNLAQQQQVNEQKATVEQQQTEALERILKENPKVKKHPSGFLYECVRPGKGANAIYAQRVMIDYKSFLLLTGEAFDQTYGVRDPIITVIGEPLFRGLIDALQLMNTGSIYRFYFPYQLAFGERGSRKVPPFTPIIYEVEMHEMYEN